MRLCNECETPIRISKLDSLLTTAYNIGVNDGWLSSFEKWKDDEIKKILHEDA